MGVARCLPCLKSCHNPDKHDEQNYVSDDQDSQGQDTEPVQAHDLDAPAAAATGHQGSNDAALKSQSEAALLLQMEAVVGRSTTNSCHPPHRLQLARGHMPCTQLPCVSCHQTAVPPASRMWR